MSIGTTCESQLQTQDVDVQVEEVSLASCYKHPCCKLRSCKRTPSDKEDGGIKSDLANNISGLCAQAPLHGEGTPEREVPAVFPAT